MRELTHASMCTGIGVFDFVAHTLGIRTIFQSEIDPFCRYVLQYYYPDVVLYGDARLIDGTKHKGLFLFSAGFPCQPYSTAGLQQGTDDPRDLSQTVLRLLREMLPQYAVFENVPALITWNDGLVFKSLWLEMEAAGYDVQPIVLPACGTGAPHQRDRIWFVCARQNGEDSNQNGWAHSFGQGQPDVGGQRDLGSRIDEWVRANYGNCVSGLYESPAERVEQEILGEDGEGRSGDGYSEDGSIVPHTNEVDRRRESQLASSDGQGAWNKSSGQDATAAADATQAEREGSEHTRGRVAGLADDTIWDDTDASGLGVEGSWAAGLEESRGHGGERIPWRNHAGTDWANWPSMPPLRVGDAWAAGLLSLTPIHGDLDKRNRQRKFTYNRWREESLMALGNAVQYEVVMQIFKAILEYDKLTHHEL